MAKSCIYCKIEIEDNSVIDICRRCGISVWGEKMLDAIINSMESARETGNLFQGSVTTDSSEYTDSRRNSRFQNFSPQQTSTENLSQQPAQN